MSCKSAGQANTDSRNSRVTPYNPKLAPQRKISFRQNALKEIHQQKRWPAEKFYPLLVQPWILGLGAVRQAVTRDAQCIGDAAQGFRARAHFTGLEAADVLGRLA